MIPQELEDEITTAERNRGSAHDCKIRSVIFLEKQKLRSYNPLQATPANIKQIDEEKRRLEHEIDEIKRRCMQLWTEIEEKKQHLQVELNNSAAAPTKEANSAADREKEQILKARMAHLQSAVETASQPYWPRTIPPPQSI